MHSVVDCALHRVGDARAPGGTRVSRKHLARGGKCGLTNIVPERAGIGKGCDLHTRILGQAVRNGV